MWKRFGRVSVVSAAVLGGGVVALGGEPDAEQLQQQVRQLQERVNQLEQQSAIQQRDLASVVEGVLRDAERRSQLLSNSGSLGAGYKDGFFIRSEDGNFELRPGVQGQFRSVTTLREEGKHGGESDVQSGFEWRRLRFRFDGNVFSPKLTYSFVWDTNRQGGGVSLLDAYAQYQFTENWALKGGQFKDPVFQERLLSGYAQLAVDRSLTDALIAGALVDRVQGVGLVYGSEKNPWRAEAAFHDGANSKNTNFLDTFDTSSPADGQDDRPDYGVGGRVAWKAFGDWKSYKDFTAKGNKNDLLVLGAGGDVTDGPNAVQYLGTIDAQWENSSGLGAFAALFSRYRDRRNVGGEDYEDVGALAQAGYMLNKQWEVFGRYDVTVLDEDSVAAGAENTFQEFTVGLNYYLGPNGSWGHRAKFTVDLVYLPDGAPANVDSLGILATPEEEWVLRGQFQLMI